MTNFKSFPNSTPIELCKKKNEPREQGSTLFTQTSVSHTSAPDRDREIVNSMQSIPLFGWIPLKRQNHVYNIYNIYIYTYTHVYIYIYIYVYITSIHMCIILKHLQISSPHLCKDPSHEGVPRRVARANDQCQCKQHSPVPPPESATWGRRLK